MTFHLENYCDTVNLFSGLSLEMFSTHMQATPFQQMERFGHVLCGQRVSS